MSFIALVTPVKNEINNLKKLFRAIEAQDVDIFLWLIVENDSTDGSLDYLKSLEKPCNVSYIKVVQYSHEIKSYQLGQKYSSIISHGFSIIKKFPLYHEIKYIGILDADCHPAPEYYKKLLHYFSTDETLGIVSGIIKYDDYTTEKSNPDHARGGCRLWRIECFNDSPYQIGLSADAISSAKAIINGWKVRSFNDAIVYSRKAGSRYISRYPGWSAYYRQIPFYYVLLKSILLLFRGQPKKSLGYTIGYLQSLLRQDERLTDKALINYYRSILLRKLRT